MVILENRLVHQIIVGGLFRRHPVPEGETEESRNHDNVLAKGSRFPGRGHPGYPTCHFKSSLIRPEKGLNVA